MTNHLSTITSAIDVIQSNPIAFHGISTALQMIPVVGSVLGKYWDKHKESKDPVKKDILSALESLKNMNSEQVENFSKKLEESNDRATLNYLLLQKIDLQQGELAEQLTGTETRVITEVQTIGTDVHAMNETMKQLMVQMTLLTTSKGIENTIDPDKKITISDEELIKFKQQAEEIEKLKKELARVNQEPMFNPDFVMKEANVYYYAGEHEKTIGLCDLILKHNSKHIDALFGKGFALYCLARYDEAIKCYDEALKINPENLSVLINKGITLSCLGNHRESVMYYDKILEIDPNHVGALDGKGYAMRRLGLYDESLACCNRILELESPTTVILSDKGNTLFCLKRYDEAIDCHNQEIALYDEILKIDPEDAIAYMKYEPLNNKGIALHYLGKYDEAIKCYDEALNINQNNPYSLYWKARTLSLLNTKETSIECLKKAINLDTKYTELAKTEKDFQNIVKEESFKELFRT